MAKKSDDFPTLIAQTGPLSSQRWLLDGPMLLGRDNSCNIVIPDRQVSRHHARLSPTDQGLLLEDLNSKNGTFCNGQQILDPIILQDGDTLQIALAQEFIYFSSDATLPISSLFMEEAEPLRSQDRLLRLDTRSRRVWINDIEILPPLSLSQFQLLELLYKNQDDVVSRSDLIKGVWGIDNAVEISEQALDALVRRLRDRLSTVDRAHAYIVTVRGHGLRLDNPLTLSD
jgi:hypothetical protein